MSAEVISLVSAVIGAVVGASASIITVLVQQHHQARRDVARMATDLALKDFELAVQDGRLLSERGQRVVVPPVGLYLIYHARLLNLLVDGKATPKRIAELNAMQNQLEAQQDGADS